MKQSKTIKDYKHIIHKIYTQPPQTQLTEFELQQQEAYLNESKLQNEKQKAKRSFRVSNSISITLPSTRDHIGSISSTNTRLDTTGWKLNPTSTEIMSQSRAQSPNPFANTSYRPGRRINSVQFSLQSPTSFQNKRKSIAKDPIKLPTSPKMSESEIALIPHHSKTLVSTYRLEPHRKSVHLTQYTMEKAPTSFKVGIERPAQVVHERRKSLQRDLNVELTLYNQEFKRQVLDQMDGSSPTLREKKSNQSISSTRAMENTLTFTSVNTQAQLKSEPINSSMNILTVQSEISDSDVTQKPQALVQVPKLHLEKILKKDDLKEEDDHSFEEAPANSRRNSRDSEEAGDLPEDIAQKIQKIKEQPFSHIPDWMLAKSDYFENLKICREEQKHKVVNILKKEASLRKYAEIALLTKFLQGVVIFSGFNPQNLMELTEKMKLQYYKKGAYICHQYDVAKEIWIIIEGKVEIHNQEGFLGFAGSGDLLGRQALDKQTLRSASLIVASVEAFVASISAEDFKTFLSSKHNMELPLNMKKAFLEGLPVFRLLRDEKIYRVALEVKYKKFFKNEVIYHKNDASGQFYILYSGAVHRETEIKIAQANQWPIAANQWRQRRVKKSVQVKVPLKVGDFFGYKETFTNMLRKEKVVASEESIVFILTKELIEKVLDPEDIYLILKYLEEISKKKKNLIRGKLLEDKKDQKKKLELLQSSTPHNIASPARASIENGQTRKFELQSVNGDGLASRGSIVGKTNVSK